MRSQFTRIIGNALLLIACGSAGAYAQDNDIMQWNAVGDERLAAMRGGYDTASGLTVSFGIQRAVYVDGNLMSATSIAIPDLAQMSAAQADNLRTSVAGIHLVQTGTGNTFDPGALPTSTLATVIQNTLNNENIRSLTVIDASVNTLGALKAMNFQSSMRDALSGAALGK